jgi:serine/threonine protein kinase
MEAALAIAGVALAIPGVVQTFIHAKRYLSRRLQSAHPSPELLDLKDALAKLEGSRLRWTLEAVEDLYCDTNDKQLKRDLEDAVKKAWGHLLSAENAVENAVAATKPASVEKSQRKAIQQVRDIEDIGESLRSQILLHAAGRILPSKLELRPSQCRIIGSPRRLPHSTVSVVEADLRNRSTQGIVHCVAQEKTLRETRPSEAYEQMRDLARVLQFTKNSEGLLDLAGFQVLSPTAGSHAFRLLFPYPHRTQGPRSLRDILLDPINQPVPPIPRNFRFILPKRLAESVYHVHSHNLVHKAIRPESILLFDIASENDPSPPRYPEIIGSPFLTDWRYTRKTMDASNLATESDWTISLYQHPERQAGLGGVAESKYNIGHDIYSLGVCLLEIGLWESFIQYHGTTPSLSDTITQARARWETDNPALASTMTDSRKQQQVFIFLAGQRLAYEMGEAYSRMVIKCLSCLENGFGNVLMFVDNTSADWEEQGVLFIQEIRRQLAIASTMGVGLYNLP